MRLPVLITFLAAMLGSASPGLAQAPPNSLLAGSMWSAESHAGSRLCVIGGGPSVFKRNGSGPARIAFPEVIYASFTNRREAYSLSGTGRLAFTNATSGQLTFDFNLDYPADIRQPGFSGYSQTYNSATGELTVTFLVNIRDCSIRVRSIYRL